MVDIVEPRFRSEPIDGLCVITPKHVADERGAIRELFRRSAFDGAGFELAAFAQINPTESAYGVVRGMHAEAMTKLVTVAFGAAFGAYIDLRPDSSTRGEVVTVELRPGVQVLVPPGVANGFQALSDPCQYLYCFDAEWQPNMAGSACSPIGCGVEWPIEIDPANHRQISTKDVAAPSLDELSRNWKDQT